MPKNKPSLKKTYVDLATKALRGALKQAKLQNKQLKAALKESEKNREINLSTLQGIRKKVQSHLLQQPNDKVLS